jgi:hypothetical protein
VTDLKKALKREGYRDRDLTGPSLLGQLKALCTTSQKQASPVRPEPMW